MNDSRLRQQCSCASLVEQLEADLLNVKLRVLSSASNTASRVDRLSGDVLQTRSHLFAAFGALEGLVASLPSAPLQQHSEATCSNRCTPSHPKQDPPAVHLYAGCGNTATLPLPTSCPSSTGTPSCRHTSAPGTWSHHSSSAGKLGAGSHQLATGLAAEACATGAATATATAATTAADGGPTTTAADPTVEATSPTTTTATTTTTTAHNHRTPAAFRTATTGGPLAEGAEPIPLPDSPSAAPPGDMQEQPQPSSTAAADAMMQASTSAAPADSSPQSRQRSSSFLARMRPPSVMERMRSPSMMRPVKVNWTTEEPEVHEDPGPYLHQAWGKFREVTWDVVTPTDPVRMRWDIWMLLLLLYVCLTAPYFISFDIAFTAHSGLRAWETLVNCSFGFDIYLNFRTAYIDSLTNKLVSERSAIARHYLTSWFPIDCISTIPFNDLLSNNSLRLTQLFKAARVVRLLRILRLLKMVRMVRLFKLSTILRRLEMVLGRGVLRLASCFFLAVLIIHMVACFFYYVATLSPGFRGTWVENAHMITASNFDRYVTALYWAMSTLATVGYGDVHPGNLAEKVYAMISMAVGITVFTYFMGAMASVLSSLNNSNVQVSSKLRTLEDFLRVRKVPLSMGDRVRSFFNFILQRQLHSDEASIMDELSVPLRTEVILYLYRDTVEKVPFFHGKEPQFLADLVTCLRLEYFAPGDVVVRQGDKGNVMYFIISGILEVRLYDEADSFSISEPDLDAPLGTAPDAAPQPHNRRSFITQPNRPINKHRRVREQCEMGTAWTDIHGLSADYRLLGQLQDGQYFGEYTCLLGELRTATVVATSYCELYSLSRQDLDSVVCLWPEMADEFDRLVAGYRNDQHNHGRPSAVMWRMPNVPFCPAAVALEAEERIRRRTGTASAGVTAEEDTIKAAFEDLSSLSQQRSRGPASLELSRMPSLQLQGLVESKVSPTLFRTPIPLPPSPCRPADLNAGPGSAANTSWQNSRPDSLGAVQGGGGDDSSGGNNHNTDLQLGRAAADDGDTR